MDFGSKLKTLRKCKQISQSYLAEEIGVSTNAISQYETNKRFPDQACLVKLCLFFDVSSDYLLGLSDIPTPSSSLKKLSESFSTCSDEQIEAINKLVDAFDK